MTKTSEAIGLCLIFRFIQLLTPVDLSQFEQQKTEIILLSVSLKYVEKLSAPFYFFFSTDLFDFVSVELLKLGL